MTQPSRRRFLKSAAGATLSLPMLECWGGEERQTAPAQRLVCVGTYLGFYQPAFFPDSPGADYRMPKLLEPLTKHRGDFTVFSGLDHRAPNGHGAWNNYLCGREPGSYSLDQMVADALGLESRFPSIQLSAGKASRTMSHTRQGVPLPMIERPSVLYKRLFASPADRERGDYLLRSGHSAIDAVLEDAKQLQSTLSSSDQRKLDEYFDALREVERRMSRQLLATDDSTPTTDYQLPGYDPVAPTLQLEAERLMYDLMALALEVDATRVLTLFIGGLGQVFTIDGETLQSGYHALSHHGNDPAAIADLMKVELEHMRCFARFLEQLKSKSDAHGRPLLDSTLVMLGTGMGDASRHANSNLPTLVAGGGFRHGSHLAIDPKAPSAPLLGDLYITLMQQLGMEVEQFSNARRNLNHIFAS